MKKYFVCSILVGLASTVSGQTYNISTVAGSVKNANGDGVPASVAPLLNPQQLAVDTAGNVYIADGDAHRVRKIDAVTGVTTVIAGQGRATSSSDTPGPGVKAPLNDPTGVALDPTGNILYIAERDAHKIKKLDLTTGVLSTVAGWGGRAGWAGDGALTLCADGTAVCGALYSRLRNPQQLAVDSLGNVYVADRGNNKIRKICVAAPVKSTDCKLGTITTVAGIGPVNGDPLYLIQSAGDGGLATQAQLARAEGVAVDSSFNVYIADTNNNKIRKVDASTGLISTVVGTCIQGAPLSTNAGGDPNNGNFILPPGTAWPACTSVTEGTAASPVANTAANGKLLQTFVDGTLGVNSTLNRPRSLTFDSAGNLYIADTSTNRIRLYNPTSGVINTVAGSGTSSGFSGDGSRAISATLSGPRGVAVGKNGNIYISDQTNGQISNASASGKLRVVDGTNGNITTLSTNQYYGDGGTGASAAFNDPRGLAIDALGNLFVADSSNNRVRKLGTDGTLNALAGNGTAAFGGDTSAALYARLSNPTCAAVDASNNVYIADRSNNRVRKVDASGNITTVAGGGTLNTATDGILAVNAVLSGPRCVALDPAGNLYIADSGNFTVRKVDLNGIISTVAGVWQLSPFGSGSNGIYLGLCAPGALTVNAAGPVFYQNCNSPGSDGVPGTSAYLNSVQGLAVDPAGKYLYISDASYHTVSRVDLSPCSSCGLAQIVGTFTLVAGAPNASGADGALGGITPPAGSLGPAVLTSLNSPIGVAADAAGNIYIADSNNYRVMMVDKLGNAYIIAGGGTTWGDSGAATGVALTMPRGIAVDATGNVYVSEALGIVRKLAAATK